MSTPPVSKPSDPWGALANIPCQLSLELDIPSLHVSDLMKLSSGSVLSSGWRTNRDLPLRVNGRLLAWVEFEGAEERMSVRVTEFAWEQKQ